jgi:hypothetical protein
VPSESSPKQIWDMLITMLMYFGYIVDAYNLAFFLNSENTVIDDMWRYDLPYIIDITISVDIFLRFFTAYQKDVEPVKDLWLIFKNYLFKYDKQNFFVDALGTIPGLASKQSDDFYWFKLIRFFNMRTVFMNLEELFKFVFQKMNLSKSNTEKAVMIFYYIFLMVIGMDVLACAWIYIGREEECSWLQGGCQDGVKVMDLNDRYTVLITAIYWVITTLTTVGYGDYKGYQKNEYIF